MAWVSVFPAEFAFCAALAEPTKPTAVCPCRGAGTSPRGGRFLPHGHAREQGPDGNCVEVVHGRPLSRGLATKHDDLRVVVAAHEGARVTLARQRRETADDLPGAVNRVVQDDVVEADPPRAALRGRVAEDLRGFEPRSLLCPSSGKADEDIDMEDTGLVPHPPRQSTAGGGPRPTTRGSTSAGALSRRLRRPLRPTSRRRQTAPPARACSRRRRRPRLPPRVQALSCVAAQPPVPGQVEALELGDARRSPARRTCTRGRWTGSPCGPLSPTAPGTPTVVTLVQCTRMREDPPAARRGWRGMSSLTVPNGLSATFGLPSFWCQAALFAPISEYTLENITYLPFIYHDSSL